jgi:hypothetical protein
MLRELDKDLWVAEQPLRFLGLPVGARMTVARLSGGRLWVHSPIRPVDALRAEVDALGTVRYLVAPNRYHHLFIADWMTAYPAAEAHAAPGLSKKRPEVEFTSTLDDGPVNGWAGEIDQLAWRGSPLLNEVVFLHRASRTLVLTDLAHNLGPAQPRLTRAVFCLLGGSGGFKTNLTDRLGARDRPAARASLEKILTWSFDRVIVSHGEVLPSGGAEALRRAYSWLLG